MSVADQIKNKLEAALGPERLEVVDESGKHKGHSGARPEGETHFRVSIVSSHFEGQNRVSRQRLVNKALKEELDGPVHALAMSTLTPSEAQNQSN
jgi:BolA protein